MHSGNIENYNFIHGLHRNLISGKWFPLHPHTLGRPLTHDEMDYNLLYSQQTVAGWRIFGQNDDLTLSDNELRKSLIFWKISADDVDYARYVAAGYTVDQYIWITPTYDCNDFMVSSESTTDTSLNTICDAFVITLSSTSPTIDSCDIFGVNSQGTTDTTLLISSGSGSGSGGAGPVPTATAIPDPTATPEPTATEVPPTATPEPTATAVPPTATPEPTATATPEPTATEVPPTATPEPTATEVPPTATPEPTATATPTPTPTVDPSLTRFSWLLATDESFEQPIDAVLEDLENDPDGCWNNSFLLQQQDAAGRQLEYFPIQPGNTYYFKLKDNIPTDIVIQGYQLLDSSGLVLEHESVGGRRTGLNLSPEQICGTGDVPYVWVNDLNNNMVYAHSPSNPGWVPVTAETKNEFGGQLAASPAFSSYGHSGAWEPTYVKIQVPEEMQVGSVFNFDTGTGISYAQSANGDLRTGIDHLDFTPGLLSNINFRVVENPNLAPTPTPSPTYDLSSAAAISENGKWSLHVTDHESGAVIEPVIVDVTQEYNANGGTGSAYYKYFPIAANEKVKVHVEQHRGTLVPYPNFVVYNQDGRFVHDSIDNTATVINWSPILSAFSNHVATNDGYIDNTAGTDVLPLLNHPREMVQIALNTPSEPFIVGRPDGLGSIGNTTMLWINESGAGSGLMVNLISLPDGMSPPTTYEELGTPPVS